MYIRDKYLFVTTYDVRINAVVNLRVRGSVVGYGTMIQAGMSWGSTPDEVIGFFN
jgi:hypothetical protein